MNTRLAALAGIAFFACSTSAQSQEAAAADWTLTRSPATNLVAATIEFDNGIGLVARCRNGVYDLMVVGVPPVAEGVRYRQLGLTVGDEGDEIERDSSWTVGTAPNVAFSRMPAMIARFLAKGGTLKILVPASEGQRRTRYVMAVEPSASALEETLTACGRPLYDLRDDQLEDDNGTGLTGGIRWVRAPRPDFPSPVNGRTPREAYAVLSCRTEPTGLLSECQVESEQPEGFQVARSSLRATRRAQVGLTAEAEAAGARLEGRLIVFSVNFRLEN